jgi:hypothetical protein
MPDPRVSFRPAVVSDCGIIARLYQIHPTAWPITYGLSWRLQVKQL